MQFTIYNQLQLDTAVKEMYRLLEEQKGVNISFEPCTKGKTKNQLGFWFKCLCGAVVDFYRNQLGDKSWTKEAVKDQFYEYLSPRTKLTTLGGKMYEHPKHISEMDREEMSEFIDKTITVIERAKCFEGLILHPSVRNCWIHTITDEEIRAVDEKKFPRKCPEYLEYRRHQCCICCGSYGCHAHHIRESESSGMGFKANDWETLSMCPACHVKYHTFGRGWFDEQVKWILDYIDLEDFVKCSFSRWYNGFR